MVAAKAVLRQGTGLEAAELSRRHLRLILSGLSLSRRPRTSEMKASLRAHLRPVWIAELSQATVRRSESLQMTEMCWESNGLSLRAAFMWDRPGLVYLSAERAPHGGPLRLTSLYQGQIHEEQAR